ncbi:MAG: HlyD family efflux transporter periplasmic adaptor subunit [Clostridia bacterium]|nr:HlyD family efflux transporter periplasmic adaptor subunit [Clostridia bacterium]
MKKRMMFLLAAACLCLAACAEAQTARVTSGSISKTVFGTGEVQPASQPGVYARIDADVLEWYAELGDEVKAGDVLMKLENDTLAGEVAQLEYDIQLAQEDVLYTEGHTQYKYKPVLNEAGKPRKDVNTGEPLMQKYSDEITIRAPSAGRVMAVYIEAGDDSLAVYRENGCVVMLSTDGRMKVELKGEDPLGLEYDQAVQVTGEGIDAAGRVVDLTRYGTEAVIQVNSDEYPMDAPVTVSTLEGEVIGEGILQINKPMAVSAYGGTVKGLAWNVQVGKMLERYDVIARIDWDETPLYYDNDKVLREYTKKKIELEKAMEKQEQLAIVAPCDGRLASIDVEKGAAVTAGTKVMSIVETGAGMQLILRIDELDIPLVEKGQQVTIAVDALPDVTLTGSVLKIAPLGNTETSVTRYDVYVQLEGEVDPRVLGGMNVSGEILVFSEPNTLLVSSEAVFSNGGSWYVQLGSGEMREVELGMTTDTQVQILSGLSEGDIVVY